MLQYICKGNCTDNVNKQPLLKIIFCIVCGKKNIYLFQKLMYRDAVGKNSGWYILVLPGDA